MKNKIIVALLALSISLSAFAAELQEATILNLDSSNSNIIKIITDTEIISTDLKLNSEVKIFKDLVLEKVEVDLNDKTKLNITLKENLKLNTSYSFLSVYAIDGNIDFSIQDEINGIEIENSSFDENISSVLIKSSKEIVLNFKSDLIASDDLEVKLLKEIKVTDILIDADNEKQINMLLKDSLEDDSNYILMLFEVITKEELKITFLNGIYDFETLDSLGEEEVTNLTKEKVLEKVALNAAETPDTGAETSVLVILTLIMSSFIFFRRKKA